MVRAGLTEKVTFEQRLEKSEGTNLELSGVFQAEEIAIAKVMR